MFKRIIFIPGDQRTHIDRCLATAQVLTKKLKVKPIFITNNPVNSYHSVKPQEDLLGQILSYRPDLVVFDHHFTDKGLIEELRKLQIRTINHCYKDPGRHACDVRISATRTEAYTTPGYFEGAEYVVLDKEFYKNGIKIKRRAKKIIIKSPKREAIDKIRKAVKGLGVTLKVMKVMNANLIRQQDLAIMPMDYSLYQCLATGIPTIILSHNLEEKSRAVYFENTNAAIHLGFYEEASICSIKEKLRKIIRAQAKRKNLSYKAKQLVNRDAWDNIHKIYKTTLEG